MTKIKKNLSDAEMLVGWQEEKTFETEASDQVITLTAKPVKKDPADDIASAYFTPELKDAVGKALLELKLKLYKEGIVDYQVKVSQQGNQIILTATPATAKPVPQVKQATQASRKQ